MRRAGLFCSVRDGGVKKGAWSSEEDELLSRYVKLLGEGKWRNLAQKAGLNRSGKSCRLRWLNYLRPGIKRGDFSSDEDELILKLHGLLGNRWALIAGRLPGRTDNEVKNYWNTTLIKKVQGQQQGSDSGPTIRKFQAEDKRDVQDFSRGKRQQILLQDYNNIGLNIRDRESSSPSMQIDDQDDKPMISSLDVFDTNNMPLTSDAVNFDYCHNLQENYDNNKGSDELENGDQKPDILVPLELQHMEMRKIASLLDIENELRELL